MNRITCQAPACTSRAVFDSNYCEPHREIGEAIEAALRDAAESGLVRPEGISENGMVLYRSLIFRKTAKNKPQVEES